jgi:hypothetical protein
MVLKLCNVAEIYSVSQIWADSEQKDENLFISQHSRKPLVIGFAYTVTPH